MVFILVYVDIVRESGSNLLFVTILYRRIDWYATWPIQVTSWPGVNLTWGQILKLTFRGQKVYLFIYLFRRTTTSTFNCGY